MSDKEKKELEWENIKGVVKEWNEEASNKCATEDTLSEKEKHKEDKEKDKQAPNKDIVDQILSLNVKDRPILHWVPVLNTLLLLFTIFLLLVVLGYLPKM